MLTWALLHILLYCMIAFCQSVLLNWWWWWWVTCVNSVAEPYSSDHWIKKKSQCSKKIKCPRSKSVKQSMAWFALSLFYAPRSSVFFRRGLQFCRWQAYMYLRSFSRCCLTNLRNHANNSEKNRTYSSSRSSKVIDLGFSRKPISL